MYLNTMGNAFGCSLWVGSRSVSYSVELTEDGRRSGGGRQKEEQ